MTEQIPVAFSTENHLGASKGRSGIRKKGYNSLRSLLLSSLIICFGEEQFVLVAASVSTLNKSLNVRAVTKQELQVEQYPTYQIDLLEKDVNKKLFAKADSSVHKVFSCCCIKLANSQTLILDGEEIDVSMSHFDEQQTAASKKPRRSRHLLYFTLLDTASKCPTLVLNQKTKTKKRQNCDLFKIPTSKTAQTLHSEWRCLWVCAQLSES